MDWTWIVTLLLGALLLRRDYQLRLVMAELARYRRVASQDRLDAARSVLLQLGAKHWVLSPSLDPVDRLESTLDGFVRLAALDASRRHDAIQRLNQALGLELDQLPELVDRAAAELEARLAASDRALDRLRRLTTRSALSTLDEACAATELTLVEARQRGDRLHALNREVYELVAARLDPEKAGIEPPVLPNMVRHLLERFDRDLATLRSRVRAATDEAWLQGLNAGPRLDAAVDGPFDSDGAETRPETIVDAVLGPLDSDQEASDE